jgi:uncharacterized coiled-coil protein SlyX
MATQARVTSIDALDSFRANLVVFVTKARQSVDAVRDHLRRTRAWLQHEQRIHWEGEIRRRQRVLDQAQQDLYSARLTGLTETVTMRQAVVRKARAAVEESMQKLRNVKKWNQNFDATADPLMKRLDSFREFVDTQMPDAIAFLYRSAEALDAYAEKMSAGDAAPAPAPTATDPGQSPQT